jgi:hypothetical protein
MLVHAVCVSVRLRLYVYNNVCMYVIVYMFVCM